MRIEFKLFQAKRSCSNILSQMDIPYRNKTLLDVFFCMIERQEENKVIDERAWAR
jgi:hypothetical protein